MKSIFTDKSHLRKEYQKLFLETLSNLNLFRKSIDSRYNGSIDELELKKFFSKDDRHLKNFLSTRYGERISYFFGNYVRPHPWDSQLSLLDRFILDSINFHILSSLIVRLGKEYDANKIEIINEWLTESDNLEIEPLPLISHALAKCKSYVYDDLSFPSKGTVSLFKLDKDKIIPNPKVFGNWLPKSEPKFSWVKLRSIGKPIALGVIGTVSGALSGLFFGIFGVSIGAVIGLALFLTIYLTINQIKSPTTAISNTKEIKESPPNVSHSLMTNLLHNGKNSTNNHSMNSTKSKTHAEPTFREESKFNSKDSEIFAAEEELSSQIYIAYEINF